MDGEEDTLQRRAVMGRDKMAREGAGSCGD